MFKFPERFPPVVNIVIGIAIGTLSTSVYFLNASAKNEAEQLDKDARVAAVIEKDFTELKLKRVLEHEKLTEQFKKFSDCGSRIPADDITAGMLRQSNDKTGNGTNKTVQPVQEAEHGNKYVQSIRDRISDLLRQSK